MRMDTRRDSSLYFNNNDNVASDLLGIGGGIGAGIFAQIARTTTEKERTGMYSIAMALRQFGLLVGMCK